MPEAAPFPLGPPFAKRAGVRPRVIARRAHNPWPGWTAVWWITVGLLMIGMSAGCRRGVPVVDLGSRPAEADGTISGTVRGPGNTGVFEGRVVEVVNLETNERQRVTTNNAGGFTFKVKPGKYRVELTLLDGESILKGPGVMNVNKSDVDAHADFIVGTGKGTGGAAARPRGPAYRIDLGLGQPMA